MKFKSELKSFIEISIKEADDTKIVGLIFNLVENQGRYHIEFVGTDTFDMDDPDWACEEIYAPALRAIEIPVEIHGDTYDQCIGYCADIIRNIASENPSIEAYFSSLSGIGIGFVDGDLMIIRES